MIVDSGDLENPYEHVLEATLGWLTDLRLEVPLVSDGDENDVTYVVWKVKTWIEGSADRQISWELLEVEQ